MNEELFKHIIRETLRAHFLQNAYRGVRQTAMILQPIPGQVQRRFLSDKSVVEQILEAILIAHKNHVPQEQLTLIAYHLIDIHPSISSHDVNEVAKYCAYFVLKPSHFEKKGTICLDIENLPKLEKKTQYPEIYNKLCEAKRLKNSSDNRMSTEARKLLQFVAFFGADSSDIPVLMEQLMKDASNFKQSLEPFELAAYIHHKIIEIHPFVDGNGRVARALMNQILSAAGLSKLNLKATKALENEYDKLVRKMDMVEFSGWLKKIHSIQHPRHQVLESQNSMPTRSDTPLKLEPMSLELEAYLFCNSKKHFSIFSQPKSLRFDELDKFIMTYTI